MIMASFYDGAGRWPWRTGLPAKIGVSVGIMTGMPSQYLIVGLSPPLDKAGNCDQAARAIEYMADSLGVNAFGHPAQPAAK